MDYNLFLKEFEKKPVRVFQDIEYKLPVVSVCVQTYQHVNFIKECLDGILMQETNFQFEILLGDDESTDGTREICVEYAEKYPDKIRLFLHHRENNIKINGNPTGRFNFLYNLYNARGKYIALCEGDDYWTDPLKLQKQVDFLEGNEDFSLCFHNVYLQSNNGMEVMHKELKKDEFETKDLLCQWFIPTNSIIFRNYHDFKLPNWFIHCISGDIPLLLLLSLRGKLKYLKENMGIYRLHENGVSRTHNGYYKVFGMIYIYQNFNVYSKFIYENEINEAMIYEINRHLPEMEELNKLRQINKMPKRNLANKIVNKLKKLLSFKI